MDPEAEENVVTLTAEGGKEHNEPIKTDTVVFENKDCSNVTFHGRVRITGHCCIPCQNLNFLIKGKIGGPLYLDILDDTKKASIQYPIGFKIGGAIRIRVVNPDGSYKFLHTLRTVSGGVVRIEYKPFVGPVTLKKKRILTINPKKNIRS